MFGSKGVLGSSSSKFDDVVEKITHETNTSENWGLILDLCDTVKDGGGSAAKDILLSLKKRLNNRDPHVVLLALSVLDSCMSNCGKSFHIEATSKEFISELKSKATGSNPKIAEKTRLLLKRWVEEECKSDPALSLMPTLYSELKKEGYEFKSSDPPKRSAQLPKDPNYASSQQEEDDIAKAIQLSLKESGGDAVSGTGSSTPITTASAISIASPLYPGQGPVGSISTAKRIVKALYDFEAAEDNELTFKAGELITVLDDSDVNWWKGSNHRGDGLFPASFVTSDLTAPVEQITIEPRRKSVQFHEEVEVKTVERVEAEEEAEAVRIDASKLEWCLQLLQDADPTGDRPDADELPHLEEQCHAMGPLIDRELENIDGKHNQLAGLNVKLIEALNLYHSSMKKASAQLQAQMQQTQGGSMTSMTGGFASPAGSGLAMAGSGAAVGYYNQSATVAVSPSQQQHVVSTQPGIGMQPQYGSYSSPSMPQAGSGYNLSQQQAQPPAGPVNTTTQAGSNGYAAAAVGAPGVPQSNTSLPNQGPPQAAIAGSTFPTTAGYVGGAGAYGAPSAIPGHQFVQQNVPIPQSQ